MVITYIKERYLVLIQEHPLVELEKKGLKFTKLQKVLKKNRDMLWFIIHLHQIYSACSKMKLSPPHSISHYVACGKHVFIQQSKEASQSSFPL